MVKAQLSNNLSGKEGVVKYENWKGMSLEMNEEWEIGNIWDI